MALTLTPNGVHHIVTVVAVHARQTRSVDSTSQLCAGDPYRVDSSGAGPLTTTGAASSASKC